MWKNLKIKGIAGIEKLVGEYNIWELNRSPYGKFKIKIFENSDNSYSGYTNIHIADELGDFYCAVGYGRSVRFLAYNNNVLFLKLEPKYLEWMKIIF